MEYAFWLMALLTALVIGLVVFLYLQAEKSRERQSTESSRLVTQVVELTMKTVEDQRSAMEDLLQQNATSQTTMLDSIVEQLQETQAAALTHAKEATKLAQQSMDLTLTRASTGLTQMAMEVSTSLRQSMALQRTSDPIAFSQVMGASTPPDQSLSPYPAVGEDQGQLDEQLEERRRLIAEHDAAMKFMEEMGVPNGGAGS